MEAEACKKNAYEMHDLINKELRDLFEIHYLSKKAVVTLKQVRIF